MSIPITIKRISEKVLQVNGVKNSLNIVSGGETTIKPNSSALFKTGWMLTSASEYEKYLNHIYISLCTTPEFYFRGLETYPYFVNTEDKSLAILISNRSNEEILIKENDVFIVANFNMGGKDVNFDVDNETEQ